MKGLLPLDVLVRLPLLPFLAYLGFRVRKTALVLPEAEGPRVGQIGQGPNLRILILGDSSAAGVGVAQLEDALSGQLLFSLADHYRISWRLIAKSGATTKSAIAMLRAEPRQTYDVAVLALGVNDAVRLLPLWLWRRRQGELRQCLRRDFGIRQVIVTQVPPVARFPALPRLLRWVLGAHAARMDACLAQALHKEGDTAHLKIDQPFALDFMARDGYHPNSRFYVLWARSVAELIASRA